MIAYATAYLKVHYPAEFYLGILNAWPMGFYSPATLVKIDGQRPGSQLPQQRALRRAPRGRDQADSACEALR